MFKKCFSVIFIGIFAVALTFAAGVLLSACGHTHAYGDWVVVTEATCAEKGLQKRVCECGEEETEEIAALGHKYGSWSVKKASTCTEDGVNVRVCERCQSEDEQIIKAAHTEKIVEGTPATCTDMGMTDGKICSVCNTILEEQRTINPLGHSLSKWAPLYTTLGDTHEGEHERHCTRDNCGFQEKDFCEFDTVTIDPTCDEGGYNIHTCQVCEYSFQHDFTEKINHKWSEDWEYIPGQSTHKHKKVCLNDSTHELVEECQFSPEETVDATCFSKGYTKYVCSDCGHSYEGDVTEQLTHIFDNWQPTKIDGVNYHQHTCSLCDTTETQRCNEIFRYYDATCTKAAQKYTICHACGRKDIDDVSPALNHDWDIYKHSSGTAEENSMHERICKRCRTLDEKKPCVFVDTEQKETCDANGSITRHCQDCLYTYEKEGGMALGHAYPQTWTYAGTDAEGKHQHKRVCANDPTHVEYDKCDFSLDVTKSPTCLLNGECTYTCTAEGCGYSYTEEIEKLGHLFVEAGKEEDFNEWITDENTHTRTCLREECQQTVTENHVYTTTNLCDDCGYDGLIYEEEDGHYIVADDSRVANYKLRRIIIPELHLGLPVTKIADGYKRGKEVAFNHNTTIVEVVLPKSLQQIGDSAFAYCSNLVKVSISGEDEAQFTPSLTRIEAYAFYKCGKLQSAENLPQTLEFIGTHAFDYCSELINISVPDSVKEIGSAAFSNTGFINNPSSWSGDALYIGKHFIRAKTTHTGPLKVNDQTKTIAESAFANCMGITEIYLPDSIVEIDSNAFLNCDGLQEVIFAGTFRQWLDIKFKNDHSSPMNYASKLQILGANGQITIDSGVTTIPAGTFKGSGITSVYIPATVTYIGEEAFENCSDLATITFEDSAKISHVGQRAFYGTAYYNNPDHWKNGVLYLDSLVLAADDTISENVVLDDNVTLIADNAFENNTHLISITLNEALTNIGQYAFKGCINLREVTFNYVEKWFATKDMGMGRFLGASDLSDSTSAKDNLTFYYTGYWKKNSMT